MKFKNQFTIDGYTLSKKTRPIIIAEGGVSHFGSMIKMKKLIDLAKYSNADFFKTQAFYVDSMISSSLSKWKKRMKKRQVSFDFLKEAKLYCSKKKIKFLCTPHDLQAFNDLEKLNVPAYKIGSGEKGNFDLLNAVAKTKKPVILSTGMHNIEDINNALDVFRKNKSNKLCLLHCTTSYPIPDKEVNLHSILKLKELYDLPIGYSDHTNSHTACIAAVALGAKVIEKHISLDFNIPDAQDWKVSCGPKDFSIFVNEVKKAYSCLGVVEKKIQKSELKSTKWALKRAIALTKINIGEKLSLKNIVYKRSEFGILPSEVKYYLGKKIKKSIKIDFPIKKQHFND